MKRPEQREYIFSPLYSSLAEALSEYSRNLEFYVDYLEERNKKLTKLEIGGVDNWEWYGEAMSNEF